MTAIMRNATWTLNYRRSVLSLHVADRATHLLRRELSQEII